MAGDRTQRLALLLTTCAVVGVAIGYLVAAKHAGEATVKPPTVPSVTPTTEQPRGPRIAFDETAWHFESLFSGEKVEHRFPFRNAGDAALRIFGVKSTCGCTVAEASRLIVEPGESAEIRILFDSKNRAGDTQKTITVSTSDPRAPHVPLEIAGRILEECWSEPPVVTLGDLQRGDVVPTKRIRVLAMKSRRVEILDLASSHPGIAFTKTPVDLADGKGFDVATMFADWKCLVSAENPNLLDAWIEVKTTSALEPTKRIRFVGQLVDDVLLEPGILSFKSVARGAEPELTATLRAAPAVAIRPTIGEPVSAAITATLEAIEEGRRYRLRVKVRQDAAVGRFHETLQIATAATSAPHVRVEINGEVKP